MFFKHIYTRPPDHEKLYELVVKEVDFVEINGVLKKRIQLRYFPDDPGDPLWGDTWIEDIGSLKGLLNPCRWPPGVNHKLLCYFQDGELAYKNPDYSECYYDDPNINDY